MNNWKFALIVKKNVVFKFASMENDFFLAPFIGRLLLKKVFFFFFNFDLWNEKKNRFSYSRTQIQFFFTNLKQKVHYTCVLNFISVACAERIKISNCL